MITSVNGLDILGGMRIFEKNSHNDGLCRRNKELSHE